jgi:hypothetical protein
VGDTSSEASVRAACAEVAAKLGLAVGDELLWSEAVPVPGPAGEEDLGRGRHGAEQHPPRAVGLDAAG